MTGTGIVTVTGVGAGVGVAVGVAVGVGVAVAVDVAVAVRAAVAVPPLGEGDVSRALAVVRLSAAAAMATPPAARNCRLVATTDRMDTIVDAATFRIDDAWRHGIARSTGRR